MSRANPETVGEVFNNVKGVRDKGPGEKPLGALDPFLAKTIQLYQARSVTKHHGKSMELWPRF